MKVIWPIANCPYCQINTAGQHEIDCPLNPEKLRVLIPCPYAEWTIWCYDDEKKCEKCPVKKAGE